MTHKSGYTALVGRPNAGKSTLLNRILGSNLAAVTPRPQTTRNRIFGIYDREDAQIVFQDTPGLLDPRDSLHRFMVHEARRAIADADVVVWLIDAIKGVTARERAIARSELAGSGVPLIAAVNKIDKIALAERAAIQDDLQRIGASDGMDVTFISALRGDGVDDLVSRILDRLGEGPKYYEPDQLSDKTQRFFVEERIREEAFRKLQKEIPYSIAVRVEEMRERPDGMTLVRAVLYVERESQKAILLGKGGAMIKQIGAGARHGIEEMLGSRVYLDLWIKVSPKWRKNEDRMREFGYFDSLE